MNRPLTRLFARRPQRLSSSVARQDSTNQSHVQPIEKITFKKQADKSEKPEQKSEGRTRTQVQIDEDLKAKMSGISGDGGEHGIEYEDGKPVAMKRSVKENMFRYI